MSYSTILQKMEIYFWTTLVEMMKNQRVFRLTLVILTIVLLGGGIAIGSLVKKPQSGSLSTAVTQELPALVDGSLSTTAQPVVYTYQQENFLVILVNSLIAKRPELEGVWLVGSASSVPQIVFLPLYPSHRKADMEAYSSLFEIDSDGNLAPSFLDYLRSKNVWWDHYLMTDRVSLAEFVQIAGLTGMEGRDWSGVELVNTLPKTNQTPEAALKAQAQIANELCRSFPGLIENTSPDILWGLLAHNMRSDLTLEKVASIQAVFRLSGGTPACDFPTLQVMTDWIGAE